MISCHSSEDMSLVPSANNINRDRSLYLYYYEGGNVGATGPAGGTGPRGPVGNVGPAGSNYYGTWLYATGISPQPQQLIINPSTLLINYTGELPGGLEWIRAVNNLWVALDESEIVISISQENAIGDPAQMSIAITNITMNDLTGVATFSYVPRSSVPTNWRTGESIQLYAFGGVSGPTGPTGGNNWWTYPPSSNVNMNNQSIVNVNSLNSSNVATSNLSAYNLSTQFFSTNNASFVSSITVPSISTSSVSTIALVASGNVSGNALIGSSISGNAISTSSIRTQALDVSANAFFGSNVTIQSNASINALYSANIYNYVDPVSGYGNFQCGGSLVAANPGIATIYGVLDQYRGFSECHINANGLEINGNTVIPGNVSFKFGTLPVSGTNTCRLEINAATSLASIVGVAPLGITFDSGAAINVSAVGTATISSGLQTIIECANQEAVITGAGTDYCDLNFQNGGQILGCGGVNFQSSGGNLNNLNSINANGTLARVSLISTIRGTSSAVNFETPGDVISSHGGGGAVSLNSVGTRVAFRPSYDIYVAPNGSSGGNGSILNPFQTVNQALTFAGTLAPPADQSISIILASGTYTENLSITQNGIYITSGTDGTADQPPILSGNITVDISANTFIEFGISNFAVVGSVSVDTGGTETGANFNFEQCRIISSTAPCITCLNDSLTTNVYARSAILSQSGAYECILMNGSILNVINSELYTSDANTMLTLTGNSGCNIYGSTLINTKLINTLKPIIVFNQTVAGTADTLARITNSTLWYNSTTADAGGNKVPIRFTAGVITGVVLVNTFLRNNGGTYALENTGGSTVFGTLANVLAEGTATRSGTFSITLATAVT